MSFFEEDIVTGPVPLPDLQILFLDQDWSDYDYPEHMENKFPSADHYVMSQCFGVLEDLSSEIVQQAVRALLIHHDGLRARFLKQDGKWIEYIAALDDEIPVVWLDISPLAQEQQKETIHTTLSRELYSLSLSHGPVMKCVYFRQGGPEPGLLFLLVNHVISDWFSSQVLVEDLHSVLIQLHQGEEIKLPPKTTSIKAWGERIVAAFHSEEWKKDIQRLIAYKRSWPPVNLQTLPLDYPEEKLDEKPSDQLQVSLSVEETTALIKQAIRVRKVRLLDLVQTALTRTVTPWAGVSAVPMCIVVHGRDPIFDDIDLSRTFGPFTMGILDVVELQDNVQPRISPLADPRLRFAQILLNFSRALEIEYESDGSEKYVSIYDKYNPQLTVNLQGYVDTLEPFGQKRLLRPFPITDWREVNTRIASKSIDCLIAIEQKQLWLTIQFSPQYFKRETIEWLAQTFLKELSTFITN